MPLFLSFKNTVRKEDVSWGVTHLFVFGQPCFVMDVRCNQIESMFLWQNSQKQHHSSTSTLSNSVVDHLAGEGKYLNKDWKNTESLYWYFCFCVPQSWHLLSAKQQMQTGESLGQKHLFPPASQKQSRVETHGSRGSKLQFPPYDPV